MKKYIKCFNDGFVDHEGESIRVDSDGEYYVFIGKHKIHHPDVDELQRRIDEIHRDKTRIWKYVWGSSNKFHRIELELASSKLFFVHRYWYT